MTLRLNVPDLAFGVFLVALGALAFALASDLTVGTAASMGPGYVPRGLAIIIMIYGLVLGIRAAFTGREPFPAIAWRPLLLISASVALFGILLPVLGLAVTSHLYPRLEAEGPHQGRLPGPFQHREAEGVADPEQGDQHRPHCQTRDSSGALATGHRLPAPGHERDAHASEHRDNCEACKPCPTYEGWRRHLDGCPACRGRRNARPPARGAAARRVDARASREDRSDPHGASGRRDRADGP